MSIKIIGGYLRLLHRVLQYYQIDLAKLSGYSLSSIRLEQASQSDINDLIDVDEYVQLLEILQKNIDRPIALLMAEHAVLQDFGLVGYLASTSIDLQQALYLFEQYYPLLYQQTNYEKLLIKQDTHVIWMTWQAPNIAWQLFYELNIALIFKITESIVQEELIPPNYIVLGYPLRFATYHYEKFFRTNIKVISQQYEICFPVYNLKAKNVAADIQINQVLSTQAKNSLKVNDVKEIQVHQFKNKILALIEKALIQEQSLQQYIAQQMYCSERTLQRQLHAYGLNFQLLVDEYRFEKSQKLLQQGKTFSDIAERLKYADQSAFSRAFKRWSGLTPKQYVKMIAEKNQEL